MGDYGGQSSALKDELRKIPPLDKLSTWRSNGRTIQWEKLESCGRRQSVIGQELLPTIKKLFAFKLRKAITQAHQI